MADLIAIREFRYHDGRQSVVVKRGERLDPEAMAKHRVDVEKMQRTGYAEEHTLVVSPKKRGRPKKGA